MILRRLILSCLTVMLCITLLQGCASDEKKQKPLPGKRVSVLEWQQQLSPDQDVAAEPFNLPEARQNQFWAQAGGLPDHAMRHVSLNPNKLKRIWSTDIGKGSDKDHRLVTPPIIVDKTVFAMDTRGKVSAVNLDNGKRLWQVNITPEDEDPTALTGGLAFDGDRLYVTDGFGFILALNPATGEKVWQMQFDVPSRASPTIADGKIYVVTLSNQIIAINAADGQILWRQQGDQTTAGLLGAPSPAVIGTTVIVTYSSGDVMALRAENGEESWSDNVTGMSTQRGVTKLSDIRGLPVVDNDKVIVANASNRSMVIDLRTGERVWQREIGSLNTPWVAGGFVFMLTTQNDLVALKQDDGKMRWATGLERFNDDDRDDPVIWSGPILAGGRLIVVGSNEKMIELDPSTGKILRETDTDYNIQIQPVVAHDTLVLLSDDGELIAYR